MVQVLPYVPSFGEKLADTLAEAGRNVAEGYALRRQNLNDKNQYDILNDPNKSPIQKATAVSKLSEARKKHSSPIFASILGEQAKAQEERNQFNDIFQPQYGQQGQQQQQSSASLSPIQNLLGAINPQQGQQQQQQLPNSQAQQQAQLIQNPSGNPQQNPQAQPNQMTGAQPAAQMNPNDPSTWSDNVVDRVAARNGPYGELGKAERIRRKDLKKEKDKIEAENRAVERDVAQENRREIQEYSKPYKEIGNLEIGVNKLKEAEKLIRKGTISADKNFVRAAFTAILEGRDSEIAELAKTPDQQKLGHLMRDSLKPKEIGGSNPSTREVLIAQAALPSYLKDQDANEFIIEKMINNAETNVDRAKEINRLRREEPNLSAAAFQDKVENYVSQKAAQREIATNDKFQTLSAKKAIKDVPLKSGHVWMIDPEGTPRQIPEQAVMQASQAGGRLI